MVSYSNGTRATCIHVSGVLCAVLFSTHFGISIYLTVCYRSFDATLYTLSATLYIAISVMWFLIMICLLLQYFPEGIVNTGHRLPCACSCIFVLGLFFALVLVTTALPLLTTVGCVFYYCAAFNHHAYYVVAMAFHLSTMLPQLVIQSIYYQTTNVIGNVILNVLFWINMLVFMIYAITLSILVLLNSNRFQSKAHNRQSLFSNQNKLYILSVVLELTLLFYVMLMLQILNCNKVLFFAAMPRHVSLFYAHCIFLLCCNYIVLSVPFSGIAMVNHYIRQSDAYIGIWSTLERSGYHSREMLDLIYALNHTGYHRSNGGSIKTSMSAASESESETTSILQRKINVHGMRAHCQCDQVCLN